MALQAVRIHITGIVQGVGFRPFVYGLATRLALHGWVRNRSDGSVEAEVAGPPEAVAALIDWARCGPPAARVAAVHVEPIDAGAAHGAGFTQRPTL